MTVDTMNFEWLVRFFLPPSFDDEEKNRQARLLYFLMIAYMICVALYSVADMLTVEPQDIFTGTPLILAIIPILGVLFPLLRRGYMRTLSLIFVVALWVIIAAAAYASGGVRTLAYYTLIVPVLLAGFLLGVRASFAAACASGLLGLLLMAFEDQGLLEAVIDPSSRNRWIGQTLIMIVLAGLCALIMDSMKDAILQLRDSKMQLAKQNDDLRDANRSYGMISQCSHALIHAADEITLLQDICRIIVDVGQYPCAWVGYAEHDARKSVRVMTLAGENDGYVESLDMSWAEGGAHARGPVAIAIRTGRPSIFQDLQSDTRFTSVHEAISQRGFASLMAFPLLIEGEVLGALAIYGAVVNAFDDTEIRLLTELTNDLAFGIRALRTRAERAAALDQLQMLNAELEARVEQRTARLVERTLQLEAIVTHFPKGMLVVFDHDLRYLIVGGQMLENVYKSREEVEGKTIYEAFPDNAAWLEKHYRQALAGETMNIESTFGERHFQTLIHPIRDQHGAITACLSIVRDITDEKQSELALREGMERERELNELRSHFVSTFSHDFRNTLAAIENASSILLYYDDRLTPQQRETRLHSIQASVEHLNAMIDDVLNYARNAKAMITAERIPLDVVAECRKIVSDYQIAVEHSHRLIFICDVESAQGQLDPRLLAQMLTNLISNAVKYSPQADRVEITLRVSETEVEINVRDFGIGIPAEDIPHLFKTYWRGRNVNNIKGTGLGLAIVQQSVEAHGGSITCESTLGEGTTFTVTLPIA